MSSFIKKRALPVILALLVLYVYGGNFGKVVILIDQNMSSRPTHEIDENTEIGQTFYAEEDNICGFSFKLATFMRANTGEVKVAIRQVGSDVDIYSANFKADSVKDNEYYDLRFPPIKHSKGKNYYIYIMSLNSPTGKAITTYMNENNVYEKGTLMINGQESTGDLMFRVIYNKTILAKIAQELVTN
ncbi:hypothetical protein ACVNS2_03035 [Paenibacillus caseinilyticus]|nr:hypothetical protein [Paenibacillus mucilaginosus]